MSAAVTRKVESNRKRMGEEQSCPSEEKMTCFNCSGDLQNEVSTSSRVKINLHGTVCIMSCYMSGSVILGEVAHRIKSGFQANKGSEMYLLLFKMIQIITISLQKSITETCNRQNP